MSLSWESNDHSYLTDEILQEAIEFDEQLEKSRQLENSSDFISDEIRHEHDIDNESEQDDYFETRPHQPLVNATNRNSDEDNDSSRYLLPSIDESSLPTTSSQEREQLNKKLSWRLDPSQSLSDWELHIFNRSSKTFEVYHVHRVVMALGPRGCEFFQDVFRQSEAVSESSSSNNNNNKTTRVPLIAESCKLVGCFLDYVYDNEHFRITNENALGLCYLADYFRNHSLWELATDFIEDDLSKASGREHLCQYYKDSLYYDQDEFLDHILSVCSRDLLSILEDGIPCSKLFGEFTPSHFMRILVDMEPPTEEQLSSALLLTRAINEFCCMHRNELSMETFDNFTSRIILLDSSSAMTLLEASLEYDFSPQRDTDDEQQIHGSEDSIASLILFQQQCIETLAEEWEETLELDQSRVTRIMRILALREAHQSILVDWFRKTVKRASSHLMAARQETEKAQQQALLLEDRCKELTQKVETAEDETAVSERNHNTTKSEMKTQISSWMRKNESTNQQRQAEQQQWEHERLRWQMEVQQLQHEKSKLKQELKHLRRQSVVSLSSQQQQQQHSEDHSSKYSSSHHHRDRYRGHQTISSGHSRKPFVIPDDSLLSDDSSTESSWDNSMLQASRGSSRRDSHAYPMNNGTGPPFRIL